MSGGRPYKRGDCGQYRGRSSLGTSVGRGESGDEDSMSAFTGTPSPPSSVNSFIAVSTPLPQENIFIGDAF